MHGSTSAASATSLSSARRPTHNSLRSGRIRYASGVTPVGSKWNTCFGLFASQSFAFQGSRKFRPGSSSRMVRQPFPSTGWIQWMKNIPSATATSEVSGGVASVQGRWTAISFVYWPVRSRPSVRQRCGLRMGLI